MTSMIRRLCAGLLCLSGLLAATAAQAQLNDTQAEQLMKLSGQWEQLESVAAQLREGLFKAIATDPKPMSAEAQDKMKGAAAAAFDIDRLRAATRRAVAENTRVAYLPELLGWYQSPQARRISQAEVDDTRRADTDVKARTQRGMTLVQAASPQRQQLLLRLVEVTRAPRSSADFILNMGVMLPLALMRFDPAAPQMTETELRARLDDQRPQLIQAFETISLAGFAIAYQGLPDEALTAYAEFLASAAGEHYNDIGEKAFESALAAAFGSIKP